MAVSCEISCHCMHVSADLFTSVTNNARFYVFLSRTWISQKFQKTVVGIIIIESQIIDRYYIIII